MQKAPSQSVGRTAVQSSRIETETNSNTESNSMNTRETPEITVTY
jgi:hypothetical protein